MSHLQEHVREPFAHRPYRRDDPLGLTAQYVPVDDQTLAELLALDDDALYDRYVQVEADLYGT
ncbi:MAG: hypothetical protein FWH11_13915, partial [Micrococcales bacterium]|nr:hypothetical protein [Micrococcales bacterium]